MVSGGTEKQHWAVLGWFKQEEKKALRGLLSLPAKVRLEHFDTDILKLFKY